MVTVEKKGHEEIQGPMDARAPLVVLVAKVNKV
jgi:hypothetical protein